jgi:2-iminobutanoate/2-iminopropanoate deaminase
MTTPMQKIVYTDSAPKPIGPYSQAVVASGSLVFTAGQIPLDPATGKVDGDDIATQTRRALANVGEILKKAGSSPQKVVKTTVFLKDMDEFAGMNAVYAEFFGTHAPARSTVEVARLPKDVKVEIEAIAVV